MQIRLSGMPKILALLFLVLRSVPLVISCSEGNIISYWKLQQSLFVPAGHLEPDAANINVVPRRGMHLPGDNNPLSRGVQSEDPAEEEVGVELPDLTMIFAFESVLLIMAEDTSAHGLQHVTSMRCKDIRTQKIVDICEHRPRTLWIWHLCTSTKRPTTWNHIQLLNLT